LKDGAAILAHQTNKGVFMRMFALLTSVTLLIAVTAAAAIEPGIGDATATLLFGVKYCSK
jgi:hypothetical protein